MEMGSYSFLFGASFYISLEELIVSSLELFIFVFAIDWFFLSRFRFINQFIISLRIIVEYSFGSTRTG
jgi:hypothetical protein